MTEEDLYSSVQRVPRAAGPGPTSQQTPAQGGAPAAPQPSAKMPAWGTAGAGVAVLSASRCDAACALWLLRVKVCADDSCAEVPIPELVIRQMGPVRGLRSETWKTGDQHFWYA